MRVRNRSKGDAQDYCAYGAPLVAGERGTENRGVGGGTRVGPYSGRQLVGGGGRTVALALVDGCTLLQNENIVVVVVVVVELHVEDEAVMS